MISNYDPNYSFGTHTIQVTLQERDYRGHISIEIGGNCKGFRVISNIAESIWDEAIDAPQNITSDCNFRVLDNEEDGECWYEAILKNDKGDTLLVEGAQDDFENSIVGVEIIAFEPENT